MRKDTSAPKKEGLISDVTLLRLHRRLLKAVKQKGRVAGIERYAAARVAVLFDMRTADTVIELPAAQIKEALGTASRNKAGKNRRVVVAWGGETGAAWLDALEAARAQSLPVVFVSEARDESPVRMGLPLTDRKLKPGEELPCITVDGHDVVAAYRVAHEAIDRARRDRGPTLILLATYRIGGSAFTDAVVDMENYLRGRGLLKTVIGDQGTVKKRR